MLHCYTINRLFFGRYSAGDRDRDRDGDGDTVWIWPFAVTQGVGCCCEFLIPPFLSLPTQPTPLSDVTLVPSFILLRIASCSYVRHHLRPPLSGIINEESDGFLSLCLLAATVAMGRLPQTGTQPLPPPPCLLHPPPLLWVCPEYAISVQCVRHYANCRYRVPFISILQENVLQDPMFELWPISVADMTSICLILALDVLHPVLLSLH